VLKLDCLSLHCGLFRYKTSLLHFKIGDMLLKVTDRLVQVISCVVHVSDVSLKGVVSVFEFVPLSIFHPAFTRKLLRLLDVVFLKFLLVFFELHQEII